MPRVRHNLNNLKDKTVPGDLGIVLAWDADRPSWINFERPDGTVLYECHSAHEATRMVDYFKSELDKAVNLLALQRAFEDQARKQREAEHQAIVDARKDRRQKRYELIASLRECPYCLAEKGVLCWDAHGLKYGKRVHARNPHRERGDEYGPSREEDRRPPVNLFDFYNGWDPHGVK